MELYDNCNTFFSAYKYHQVIDSRLDLSCEFVRDIKQEG